MKKHILAIVLGVAYCGIAAANERCPAVTEIQGNGVYRSPTASSGEWIGIAPAGASGAVVKFNSAIFYPAVADDANNGTFGKCSYELTKGIVDLRFKPSANPEPTVKLVDFNEWHRKSGPFGIYYYECASENPVNCKFDLVK